ncbi:MAG: hypothetical protein ACXVRH_01320 [Thermoleophilaceae bacterium]
MGAPRLSSLGVASNQPVTDGVRYLAFPQRPSGFVVYDFSAGTSRKLPLPSCGSNSGNYQPPVQLEAVGGGSLAWGCLAAPGLLAENLASGVSSPYLLDTLQYADIEYSSVEAIGTRRASLILNAYHATTRGLMDLQTHVLSPEPAASTDVPPLDGAEPAARMCAPLHRVQPPYHYGSVPFNRFFYEPPYGATMGPKDSQGRAPILLERCGHGKAVLSRCSATCTNLQLSAGIVTWYEPGHAFAYFAKGRRKLSWSVPNVTTVLAKPWVGHTRTRLIVGRPTLQNGADMRIFVARVP